MADPNVTSVSLSKRKNSPVTLEDIYNQNVQIKNDTQLIGSELSELKKNLTATDSRVHNLELNSQKSEERLKKADLRLNALEQFNLRKCMEIKGVSENDLRNINDIRVFVINLLRKFEVQCEVSKIEKAYKKTVHTAKPPFALIVVWFNSDDEKSRVMSEKYNNEKIKNIKSGIFLNHALTAYNRALYTKTLSIKSQIGMNMVFIRNGNVTVKENRDSRPKFIRSFEDIDQMLMTIPNDTNFNSSGQQGGIACPTPRGSSSGNVTTSNQKVSGMSMLQPTHVSSSDLSIFQLNVRGLNDPTKFSILKSSLSTLPLQSDILIFTEVKLKPNFPTGIYALNGYHQYCALRNSEFSKGGVIVYVKKSLDHTCEKIYSNDFDKILVDVPANSKSLKISCCYRPPNSENFHNFMTDLEDEMSSFHGDHMVLGDLNIDWLGDCMETRKFRDLLASYGYTVTNNIRTRPVSGKIIDHVVCNFIEHIPISNFTIDQDK